MRRRLSDKVPVAFLSLASLTLLHCSGDGATPASASPGAGGSSTGGTAGDGGATAGDSGVSAGGAAAATGGAAAAGAPSVPNTGVAIPNLACGGVRDANLDSPFVMFGDRKVFVDYACNKPKGTKVTFILNIHGTQAQEAGKAYIRSYFNAANYTDSHDFIVATPKSVVSQWGNGDNGQDLPHLLEVVDWMYANFKDFEIANMWIVGHSWGSAYTLTFACRPEFEGKVNGVGLLSGGSSLPACADKLSVIATVGETDIVPGQPDQTTIATAHGCDAKSTREIDYTKPDGTASKDVITEWANCSPGWTHRDYFMNGKGHGFNPLDWPDADMQKDMMDGVKATRP